MIAHSTPATISVQSVPAANRQQSRAVYFRNSVACTASNRGGNQTSVTNDDFRHPRSQTRWTFFPILRPQQITTTSNKYSLYLTVQDKFILKLLHCFHETRNLSHFPALWQGGKARQEVGKPRKHICALCNTFYSANVLQALDLGGARK
jgi:hypothetical protein